MLRVAALLALALPFAACARSGTHAARTPNPVSTLLIESKGVTMPLHLALRSLAFTPFVPKGSPIVQAALIPPLNVEQQRKHGLALEYTSGGGVFLLSEWPEYAPAPRLPNAPCSPAPRTKSAVLWTTRAGLVMTLQADGAAPGSHLASEARRLVIAGAC